MNRIGRKTRSTLHCAFIPATEWESTGFSCPTSWPPRIEPEDGEPPPKFLQRMYRLPCPGASVNLPQVSEAVRYHRWFEKGALDTALMGSPMTPQLRDALDILSSSIAEVDLERVSGKG